MRGPPTAGRCFQDSENSSGGVSRVWEVDAARQADISYSSYLENIMRLTRWLLDTHSIP